jgi:putative FmdB family regulatory protein
VRFERLQRMSDDPLTTCPECTGSLHRVFQPVGIIFKGSGFYVTDNRAKSSTAIPGCKKGEEADKTEDKSETKAEACADE